MTKKHSNYYNEVIHYCKDITSGKILAGTYTKKSVKRFLNDLNKEKQESWLYRFDEDQFVDVVSFAESLILPDTKQEIKLLPWQLFIYANLFGFVYKDNSKRRRFRQAYCEVARKNGKTSGLLFPLILYDFLSTNSAESYMFSANGSQSEKTYDEVTAIVKSNIELDNLCDCYSNAITMKEDTSRISFFSADATAIDGYRNSMTVLDEFWNYSDDKPLTSARYGGRARLNNLVVVITSAGLDVSSPCYAENAKCKSILNGTLTDESYFGIIYAYDETDDWKNPAYFIKANPSLGAFLKQDILESDLADALITISHQPDFKSKTCGIWTNDVSRWIPIEKWIQETEIDYSELENIPCYGGIDLSSVNDISAYSLCWEKDGKYYFKHHFYIPSEQVDLKYKNENINFLEWIEKGFVSVVDGSTIDYDFIFNDIVKDYERFKIQEIAYDRWQSNYLINKLDNELPKINYIEFDQSLKKFAPPTKEYEKKILEQKIVDPNPVMTWMLSNVVIKPDSNNNYKPLKEYKSSNKRIDGVITSIMSLDRCSVNGKSDQTQVSFSKLLSSF